MDVVGKQVDAAAAEAKTVMSQVDVAAFNALVVEARLCLASYQAIAMRINAILDKNFGPVEAKS